MQLPAGYRAKEILGYHARDPEGLSERSEGNRIWKALHDRDGPAVLELSFEKERPGRGACEKKLGPASHGVRCMRRRCGCWA